MTHHAYYIEGPQSAFGDYEAALRPFWAKKFDAFGIEDARKLIEFASLRNAGEALFLLGVSSITSEAQQALLKLFEEPTVGAVFILMVPYGILLPTLRSRMLAYAPQQSPAKKVLGSAPPQPDHFLQDSAATFLRASGKTRSDVVAKLLKDDEGAKERVREFLGALERELAPRIQDPQVRAGLADIAKVREYVADRSPSLKMLLELLAVTLPNV